MLFWSIDYRGTTLNKTHACYESQLRLAGFFTAILNHLAQQALMHACAVGFIMQRHKAPIAQGADAVASTLFSSHLPQVERFYARYHSHDGMWNSVLIVTICKVSICQYASGCDKLGGIWRLWPKILPRPGLQRAFL